jgi:hypothetical protein
MSAVVNTAGATPAVADELHDGGQRSCRPRRDAEPRSHPLPAVAGKGDIPDADRREAGIDRGQGHGEVEGSILAKRGCPELIEIVWIGLAAAVVAQLVLGQVGEHATSFPRSAPGGQGCVTTIGLTKS